MIQEMFQTIVYSLFIFIINYSVIFLGICVLGMFLLEFYNKYLKINKNTDNVDLVARYCYLTRMRKKNETK